MKPIGNNNHINFYSSLLSGLILVGLMLTPGTLFADVPNVFSANEKALADEVNENFSNLDSRLSIIESSESLIPRQIDCGTDPDALKNAITTGIGRFEITAGPCNGDIEVIRGGRYEISGSPDGTTTINGGLRFFSGYAKLTNLTISGRATGNNFSLIRGRLALIETDGVTLNCNGVGRAVYLEASSLSFKDSSAKSCVNRTIKIINGSSLFLYGNVTLENSDDKEVLWARRSSTIEIWTNTNNNKIIINNNSGIEEVNAIGLSHGSSLMIHSDSGLELTGRVYADAQSSIEAENFIWNASNGIRQVQLFNSSLTLSRATFTNVEIDVRYNSWVEISHGGLTNSTIDVRYGGVATIRGYGSDGTIVEENGGASNNVYSHNGNSALSEAPMEFFHFHSYD